MRLFTRQNECDDAPAVRVQDRARRVGGQSEIRSAPGSNRQLRANVAWMLAGNVSQGFTQWFLVVVLAKLGTIEMVGNFTLGLAIGLPILMFGTLSLRSIQLTDGDRLYRFLDFLFLRTASLAAALLVIVIIAASAHYSVAIIASVALISLAKTGEYLSDVFYGLLQREEHMAGIAISMALRGTLSLGALAAGVWLTGSLLWGAAGMAASSLITLLAFDLPRSLALMNVGFRAGVRQCTRYLLADRGACGRLRSLAIAGLPLGAVLMLVSLNLNLPRYFVEHSLGVRELGIFSSLTNVLAVGSVVINALGQGVTPRLAKYFESARMKDFRSLLMVAVGASLAIGAVGLAGALLFGRHALSILYQPEYASQQDSLVWLMAASAFVYAGAMLGSAVTAVRCFMPQLPLFAIAAATTAGASMILVPSLGMRGAALAILISAVVQCAGGAHLLRTVCRRAATAPVAALSAEFS